MESEKAGENTPSRSSNRHSITLLCRCVPIRRRRRHGVPNRYRGRTGSRRVAAGRTALCSASSAARRGLDSRSEENGTSPPFFGTYEVPGGIPPAAARLEGSVVHNLSTKSLAPFPPIASPSVSKAAASSQTRPPRALPAQRGVRVRCADRPGGPRDEPAAVGGVLGGITRRFLSCPAIRSRYRQRDVRVARTGKPRAHGTLACLSVRFCVPASSSRRTAGPGAPGSTAGEVTTAGPVGGRAESRRAGTASVATPSSTAQEGAPTGYRERCARTHLGEDQLTSLKKWTCGGRPSGQEQER